MDSISSVDTLKEFCGQLDYFEGLWQFISLELILLDISVGVFL
jgi:hypothetical protein